MSDTTHDDPPPAHEPDDAGHGHGGPDEQDGHGAPRGPIDWFAWGAGILGVGAGLAVAIGLYASTAL